MGTITVFEFGKLADKPVMGFRLENANGLSMGLCSYGARLTSLKIPDRNGLFSDVVLGFADFESYVRSNAYHGATCGRYSNRIRRGSFQIDGEEVRLTRNDRGHHLHGGDVGFDQKVWAHSVNENNGSVTFFYESADGEQGYPGCLQSSVTYSLNDKNELVIRARASTTKPTAVSIINHTYWNLAGENAGSLQGHMLTIPMDTYLPVDKEMIPTGAANLVSGSRYDFRNEAAITERFLDPIGARASDDCYADADGALGFDNTWRPESGSGLRLALKMREMSSGRCVEVFATAPSIQFYTASYLQDEVPGKSGKPYKRYSAFTMEPQCEPDAPNHEVFSDPILRPGEIYESKTVYKFSTFADEPGL